MFYGQLKIRSLSTESWLTLAKFNATFLQLTHRFVYESHAEFKTLHVLTKSPRCHVIAGVSLSYN